MSIVEAVRSVSNLSLGNVNGAKIAVNPRKGICPDYQSCKNYMPGAYDCDVERNLGLNRLHKFPCYSHKESLKF